MASKEDTVIFIIDHKVHYLSQYIITPISQKNSHQAIIIMRRLKKL